MRRMLTVAAVTAGAAMLLAVVLFGRSHADAIKQPTLVLPAPASRSPAAAFSATTLSGSRISLAGYGGKPLVLNFFAAWCEPCKREAPALVQINHRYGRRVGMLSVAVRTTTRASLTGFVRQHDMTWPVVWDRSGSMIDPYKVLGQPVTYIIDAQGRVVYEIVGETTAQRIGGVLDKLLA
jgi:cytochrome c biogenesis protein CcmG, thiol:disulfide interchange protein DsbE